MTFKLKWNGEIIEDEIATKEEAKTLQAEYAMAYGGSVIIRRN